MQASAPAATGAASSGMESLIGFAPLLLVFVIMYVLVLRPQQQQVKTLRRKIADVKRGDTVVTGGGIVGKVTKTDEAEVEVEIAQGVKIKVVRATLSDVRPLNAKPAND
ncbi:MAG: preprotein translocase subunit YajC [Alphaproteobacteria bacterium]|nr:preprotein translocase subunit YajC [Alphaproteobacteria bacterium]